ncbi:MAG: hypothetical protein Q4P26_13095 [Lachnospiraceae bacterium]|nr:hypothetical protein [Lachnospiraceae bacterium]
MRFGLEQMNDIISKVAAGSLPYPDSVIVGDNSSGKSLILKKFIQSQKEQKAIYFIDAVNRGFDVTKLSKSKSPLYHPAILETRLDERHFNVADSFSYFGTSTECIEMIYLNYENKVQELFYELTGDQFEVLYGEKTGEVSYKNGRGLLSSGYQALVRILLELLFYQETVIEKEKKENAWIVIDELDEFLSPRYAARILEFLKQKFPWAIWLVATHSCDLVANTSHANLIVLDKSGCEVLDIDDYASVSEVEIVFERLFGTRNETVNENDRMLRILLNNRMNDMWGEYEKHQLEILKSSKLSASQKMILKQIQDW